MGYLASNPGGVAGVHISGRHPAKLKFMVQSHFRIRLSSQLLKLGVTLRVTFNSITSVEAVVGKGSQQVWVSKSGLGCFFPAVQHRTSDTVDLNRHFLI
jgi:hypothetical protein